MNWPIMIKLLTAEVKLVLLDAFLFSVIGFIYKFVDMHTNKN